MITVDKIVIRVNRIIRNLLFHFVFWYCSLLFYIFLTGDTPFFKTHLNFLELDNIYLIILVISAGVSLLLTVIDGIFSDRMMRVFPRRLMIFIKSLLYLVSVFILLLFAAKPSLNLFIEKGYMELISNLSGYLPQMNNSFLRFLVYFYLSGFFINFLKGVEKKVGRGNFRSWMFGMLNKPMEQERIFMFIDMKSSTSIAEKLKHKKYSHLVQDIFNDLVVVYNYQGEIYQYLGDGAIISWNLKDGLRRNNFLNAFFAFKNVINKRRRYYNRKYGLVPKFKAGAHAGKVMVLQVGQIRRDISYNGDAINTAARIESVCNDYKQEYLISGDLYNLLKDQKGFNIKNIDKIKLKGKRKEKEIYHVKKKK